MSICSTETCADDIELSAQAPHLPGRQFACGAILFYSLAIHERGQAVESRHPILVLSAVVASPLPVMRPSAAHGEKCVTAAALHMRVRHQTLPFFFACAETDSPWRRQNGGRRHAYIVASRTSHRVSRETVRGSAL